ncbi:MAG: hypothetical protein M3O03_14435 [Pseudomonadota bacterium]|nr:hypothetical protein [Pseudomonadota bacterium]
MMQIDDSLAISGADLKRAVAAGVVDGGTADRLVAYVMVTPAGDAADDERLRLITGFNDIFVGIGLTLFFGALFFVGGLWAYAVAPVAAWGLSELFTRRMRMALPSIMLLVIFTWTVFLGCLNFMPRNGTNYTGFTWLTNHDPVYFALSATVTLLAVGLHWWRFHVPITVAAGVAAAVGALMGGLAAMSGDSFQNLALYVLLILGLCTFGLAMYFDMQDRLRRTQLADRAFWLHMLAAPMIIHPLMASLRNLGGGGAASTFLLFALVALVALVIDRRALLVSSLGYLIATFGSLATAFGGSEWSLQNLASGWGVLMVGVLVLLLSVAWRPLRARLVSLFPMAVQDKVPVVQGQ